MLPDSLHNLPYNGKRIFNKFYDRSLQKFNSAEIATKLAVCAVRKKYMLIDGRWQARPDANDSDTTSSSSSCSSSSGSGSDIELNNDNVSHSRRSLRRKNAATR
ncbi:hypothetical protein AGNV_102 [Anticarsia gemmatalis nucleopolyhedrovirus]|uniref:ChaB-like protein n=1 Tax=Anticarsia gemmatalis multiple nucleopolyhedrovirus TaxID=268591 RepID=A0A0S3IXN4_9ABAC|nr:hypothetical protein AGNV_102 [Anticarsia gemmatalis nucleopolyhedrovirus]ABI13844.1 hypothetical protein AGNV_102 [Anticarsia gemmatalis multiple nucleopolyhedrovirus]ALR69907.1 hypothetical protein AGNV_102 [Anticarsia gemmatalis multiple nucleopolyhedrovirus]ALR70065.1 hypothetical protein AGNV_102 [Anticarsia gemmatalis multiple nucleopolyhedrovirus]ALR70222.1 hypothetical protein AGNV_102 [Anticarsia gemmatalis multiple nucleopolyhedrovirus]ALR70379.1 hypothetical protein AGNV_102 [Ant